jgi:hypothetical protein
MDRRTFAVMGAGALAMTATGAAAAVLTPAPSIAGEAVILSGWLTRAGDGAAHYFVLGPDANAADASPGALVVYPADATSIRPGKVSLKGRLYRGKFKDAVTGRAATAVLTGAVLV